MAKYKKTFITRSPCADPISVWSFTADFYEAISDIELVSFLKENNGTWTSNANMWNALAMQCDSLQIFKITTMYASLSAIGKGCVLGGVKRMEPLVFVGSIRIDSFVWGAELLAGAMIAPEDVSALNKSTRLVFDQFGTHVDLWEDTLCYETLPLPEYGKSVEDALPQEYGCIWSDPTGKDLHVVHIDKAASKYFQTLSNWVGWGWLTIDSLHVSTLYLRARLHTKIKYRITNTEKEGLTLSHLLELAMGLDSVLYYVMLLIEVVIILINSMDSWVVALLVVRSLTVVARNSKRGSSYLSKISSMTVRSTKSFAASKDTSASSTTGDNKTKKDETLSKVLLYTDLTCVAFRKQVLALLLVIDAFFSWLYIVPNSALYVWSTSIFQIGSAYLSNFRVWTVVLAFIDQAWRFAFVLANERLAALITEFTHITSFEIMLSTLLAVYLSCDDLLNVCIVKWGAVDSQRQLVMLTTTNISA
ncbi:hypothetical protein Poli38472_003488 [Pythium oligandrum]|uniref:Uncharacterized protein n=1 Tax=Pythium oligandrum TaxID=41045 RepID=A0A8K1C7A1_PYTOL|nr:hypothetical protein Poli38472_003488 [Pythium oligandrum]|eukprot:TMW57563.1 hypothetical protein Poli38472_003488 [Pythium oligandrum]